jgi:hypothetical protein
MTTTALALALHVSVRRRAHLAPVDLIILTLYFPAVIFIGLCVKGLMNTSEDLFLAGRDNAGGLFGLPFCTISSIAMWAWLQRDAGAVLSDLYATRCWGGLERDRSRCLPASSTLSVCGETINLIHHRWSKDNE